MTIATLSLLSLNDDQQQLVAFMRNQLVRYQVVNQLKSDLYEGKFSAFDLGISAPEGLPDLIEAVCGWPGTVVDVLEERLEFLGWAGIESDTLEQVAADNQLQMEAGRGHLDGLIYGVSFVTVGSGDVSSGEPEVLITMESTTSCTVLWDYRKRRAMAALSQTTDVFGRIAWESLYLPNETIRFTRGADGRMVVEHRDYHGLGRVPVARLLNRDRASDPTGRSEITRAVKYLTSACIRTLAGMEVNREFYTSPKWTALNADPEIFGMSANNSAAENRRKGWSATQGRLNVIPVQEGPDGEPVEVKLHEFRPAPPTPYIEQAKCYSQMLSAETGIPSPYLGFVTDNPSSADAIRQEEYRLVKRAERRQTSFGAGWMEVGRLTLMLRQEYDPDEFRKVSAKWRDAATPTRAATADETTKYIAAGVLPADSKVTLDRIGFTDVEQRQLEKDRRRSLVAQLVENARNQPPTPAPAPGTPGQAANQPPTPESNRVIDRT